MNYKPGQVMTITTVGIVFVVDQVVLGPVSVQGLSREPGALRPGAMSVSTIHQVLAVAIRIRKLIHLLRLGQVRANGHRG